MDWMDNDKEIEAFVMRSMESELEKGKALVLIIRELKHLNALLGKQMQINETIYNILDEIKE